MVNICSHMYQYNSSNEEKKKNVQSLFLECNRNKPATRPLLRMEISEVELSSLFVQLLFSLLLSIQPTQVSLPTAISACSTLTTQAAPAACGFGWQLHVVHFVKCSPQQLARGVFNGPMSVIKSVLLNEKPDSFQDILPWQNFFGM